MLVPIERFVNLPILSLQTGAELARIGEVIIDPQRLKIAAFRVTGNKLDHADSVLHPEDIREIGDIGVIIDDSDKLMSTDGLVRLQKILEFGFVLNGIKVEDDQKHKLGSVKSYSLDPESFVIQQLYVKPPLLSSFSVTTLTVHRSQIISIDNAKIIVKSPTITEKNGSLQDTIQVPFANPFRAPTQPEGKELGSS